MSNPAHQKKPVGQDWHPADVIAALRKLNWSMRQLSLANGLQPGTLNVALARPYPRAESIIAKALGIEPKTIWPSRYNADGTSNRAAQRPVMNGPKGTHICVKRSGVSHQRNLQSARG
jgi:Ner family transcriptional regulator